ncbi:alpha/beta fold hydrolase [Arthrobacter sp. efr-133-TYG-104]|uniref:alpha/beta fold hydrolase n=1 Tax=Arthrobacter sp. efr-133-TYG-104 TaxID=3040324 RepID=UPI00254A91FF|nr:alpha/beta fold hydrolase [Arthrobacter sp. efr-133-TYG-104]
MTGRHTVEQHRHTVEGTDPGLFVQIHEPANGAGLRPVLLIHGFSSSSKLNWQDSGWITALQEAGRRIITVDLPGHGRSYSPEDLDSYTPSRIRADFLQIVTDAGARPLREGDPATGVDVIGYSLGSRLAWEFGATQPDLVHRMVLGGPSTADPLAAFDLAAAQRHLADGTPIDDASTAGLLKMAQLLPSNNLFAMLSLIEAIKEEPFDPSEAAPHMPLLLVAGEKDERAATMPELAAIAAKHGANVETLLIPGRTHTNVVTSRAFKEAAVEFLGV